ncbi:MAG: redoxin family protein [Acidobacteriota bacterium]|nr:redoxin family protein [Acidobacteriota bacterium]
MKSARAILLLVVLAWGAYSQRSDHVKWSLEINPASAAPGAKVLGSLKAAIDPGWHLYSLSTPPGPIATTIKIAEQPAIERSRILEPKPVRKFDPNFNADTETYEGEAVFLLELQLAKNAAPGPIEIAASPRYQVCSDKSCIPPVTRQATATLTVDPNAPVAALTIPSGYAEAIPAARAAATPAASETIFGFLAIAFGFGLASIFTPCVFPMIPITMSFFLNKKDATRREMVMQAGVFCLGIVVLFSGLGLLATSILGPFGVVQLGSNPWVNGLIACIFLIFGLSLLGAFEITIPSAILTRLNSASQKGGILGTLLMGLTFSLASFACVGPFVGTLLAASVQGGGARPFLGMVAFAAGLALPFFLLALFPSYLKKLPKSGGWLARVKVVMGFVILAAMLKYVSSIDQVLQWGFLTRERFLAAWIVLFAMAGFYLLGYVRLDGISKDEPLGLGRLLTGMAFVIFALTLFPGMSGGKLGELDGYVPVATNTESAVAWMKNDLPGALEKARREGKLVLVNFTGYACTNCHWMKANMFTRPEIASALKNFVLVDLYTDGNDAASQANQKLEDGKFATIAIPFYAIFDANQKVLATFPTGTRKTEEYLAFLNTRVEAAAPVTTVAGDLTGLGLKSIDGTAFDEATLSGKVVVINFWATWCVPCRQEIPAFNRMNAALEGKGLRIVGISMDDDGAAVVTPFLKQNPMRYAVALGPQALNDRFQITQLPVTVVCDRNGKIARRFEGFTPAGKIESIVTPLL